MGERQSGSCRASLTAESCLPYTATIMFTWIPLYEEAATALRAYRDRQPELVQLLVAMREAGLPTTPVEDQGANDTRFPLREIDPFTFLGNFNRGVTRPNRLAMWEHLRKAWKLTAPLPGDFDGIPNINLQNAWLIPYAKNRQPEHVPVLWDFFEHILEATPERFDTKLFDSCLTYHGVGCANLTMGMFWARPKVWIARDKRNLAFATGKGVALTPKNGTDYQAWLAAVTSKAGVTPVEFSHQAWLQSGESVPRQGKFKLTEAQRASLWERFKTEHPKFESFAKSSSLNEVELDYKRKGLRRWEEEMGLAQAAQLAAKGRGNEVLAVLKRRVQLNLVNFNAWDRTFGESTADQSAMLGRCIAAASAEEVEKELIDAIFKEAAKRKLKPAWDALSVTLWAMNPAMFFPIKIMYYRVLAEEFGWVLPSGGPSAAGFYELMAFGEAFRDMLSDAQPADWTDIQSFIWSVCPEEDEETELSVLKEETVTVAEATRGNLRLSYTKSDALADLFMEEAELDKIMALWRRKRNLILQGAPGTGKTFIARRLAYLLMAQRDGGRVQMVQFHQSSSYEDFIQGIRPDGVGFSVQPGVFYTFCRRAMLRPDEAHVFIIDEINRGNLSKVFGELMMLIEPDKRGPEFAMRLSYSRDDEERFFVPENVYLIGTMNTADRSLSLVDYALRRRFGFWEMQPGFATEAFAETLTARGAEKALIREIRGRMERLNEMIAEDRSNPGGGHRIGHSFFVPPADADAAWLEDIIAHEILPLVEEYWVDDDKKRESARRILTEPL